MNWVVISRAAQWVFLAPEVDEERVSSYRATLSDAVGHILWEENHHTSSNAVEIGIPAGLLRQGEYVLTLEVRYQHGKTSSYDYSFTAKFTK